MIWDNGSRQPTPCRAYHNYAFRRVKINNKGADNAVSHLDDANFQGLIQVVCRATFVRLNSTRRLRLAPIIEIFLQALEVNWLIRDVCIYSSTANENSSVHYEISVF